MTNRTLDGEKVLRLALFMLWAGFVGLAAVQHVVWRDEVRALSLALAGDGVGGFFAKIHGEGHPSVWYILLRLAYGVVPRPEVLPAVSLLAASAAMIMLVAKAPFSPAVLALIIFSHIFLFEYSVMARNYGISAPLILLFAILYRAEYRNGLVLGGLLFVLENCNLHSIVIAGAFLLLWGVDLVRQEGFAFTAGKRALAVAGGLAAAGAMVCAVTVLPTFNDAVVPDHSAGLNLGAVLRAILDPAWQFNAVTTKLIAPFITTAPNGSILEAAIEAVTSLVMFAALLGLIRRPAAALAGIVSLTALSLFFLLAAPGGYRHDALWLVFLIALYWISANQPSKSGAASSAPSADAQHPSALIHRLGYGAFIALLALQLVPSLADLARAARPGAPLSRSRDLANLIRTRPALFGAVVMGEPDYLVEPLPFYIDNPTYLVREDRFGRFVRFTRSARLDLSLGDLLGAARRVRAQTGRAVVILLEPRLDGALGGLHVKEGVNWSFSATPSEITAFRAATLPLARFAPAQSDESFDVFLLR